MAGQLLDRILITGASGFIGQACLDLLVRQDVEIHALTRQISPHSDPRVCWHEFDLLNETAALDSLLATIAPTHLLHLAWDTTPATYLHSKLNLTWLSASTALLQSFIAAGGQRVVFCGSCAEYDWRYGLCVEDKTPTVSHTLYSASKISLHTIFNQMCKDAKVSSAWLHPFYLFGPREDPNRFVPKIIRSLLNRQPVNAGHGQLIRDYIYIEDAANAINQVLQSDYCGSFNIARGQALAMRDLVLALATVCDAVELVQFDSLPVKLGDMDILIACRQKMHNLIGWQPQLNLQNAKMTVLTKEI